MTVHSSQGQLSTGSCQNARNGFTFHKCEMECNFDGSCTETVSQESCGCDGIATFATVQNSYQASISHRAKMIRNDVEYYY